MFRIRVKETEEDMAFFNRLEYESFKTTLKGVSEEAVRAIWIEFKKSDTLDPEGPDHQIFIAEDEEGVLAGLIWLAKREPFYVFKERLVWIYNIHVIPEFRRRGLARRLHEKAEEWVRQQGLNSIGLHVLDHNKIARDLYEFSGYKLVATHNESCFYEKKITKNLKS